jgi:uncharacterized heparinase superfamily protein
MNDKSVMVTSDTNPKPIKRARRPVRQRIGARLARYTRIAKGFRSQPAPRSFGIATRGLQMAGGNIRLAGFLVEAPDRLLWDIDAPDQSFENAMHGFRWLDDLVSASTPMCRETAQVWVHDWVKRYGTGAGPGWTPELTGRRLLTWLNHSLMLLSGQNKETQEAYFKSLSIQAKFLSKCWHQAAPGQPRFEAIAGWAFCILALEGREKLLPKIIRMIGRECDALILEDGGIATRNPEELMEIFSLLAWMSQGIDEAGEQPDKRHLLAMERIAPSLRALRLGDGGLVRFHGGGAGLEGKLDQALSDSGVRLPARVGGAMGYGRVTSGGVVLIADTASVPAFEAAENAHASTLAFEMSSGLYPIIISTGPGYAFGEEWRNGARATLSHSTLNVDGVSSSRFANVEIKNSGRKLTEIATVTEAVHEIGPDGPRLIAEHDGYMRTHGLIHRRELVVLRNGSEVQGFDGLEARRDSAKRKFNASAEGKSKPSVPFSCHFHIHPDVDVNYDMGGKAVSLSLLNGEVWVFRQEGGKLAVKNSTCMDPMRLKPRATKQVVVSSRAINYEGAVTWTLTRIQARHTG